MVGLRGLKLSSHLRGVEMTTILTYGTFDLFHIGHLNLLNELKSRGDRLVVGVSSDKFNASKGKKTIIPFDQRIEIVRNIKSVDEVFAEESWDQKISDISKYKADVFAMGDDWVGKFDFLTDHGVKVLYLPRTIGISSSQLKDTLRPFGKIEIAKLKEALDVVSQIIQDIE